jgi:hypothetical protein
MTATVIRMGALCMQVCVPHYWSDEQVVRFANTQVLCGTTNGWCIRKEVDKLLAGDPERKPCSMYNDHVHIMLDA